MPTEPDKRVKWMAERLFRDFGDKESRRSLAEMLVNKRDRAEEAIFGDLDRLGTLYIAEHLSPMAMNDMHGLAKEIATYLHDELVCDEIAEMQSEASTS